MDKPFIDQILYKYSQSHYVRLRLALPEHSLSLTQSTITITIEKSVNMGRPRYDWGMPDLATKWVNLHYRPAGIYFAVAKSTDGGMISYSDPDIFNSIINVILKHLS